MRGEADDMKSSWVAHASRLGLMSEAHGAPEMAGNARPVFLERR